MVEAGHVEEKLGTLIGRIGSCFSRVEPVRQIRTYIRGLMSDLPRKNCWTLAEYACDATPGARDVVVEHLADPHSPAVSKPTDLAYEPPPTDLGLT
ncbi:hypothetical protein [Phytohabitans maris]|uniref:hypothetical protein n=1 Tax=Phytohabitans maris TaxID=3071409 RepID=UPI003D1690B1